MVVAEQRISYKKGCGGISREVTAMTVALREPTYINGELGKLRCDGEARRGLITGAVQ
jgi:hypothetical protein